MENPPIIVVRTIQTAAAMLFFGGCTAFLATPVTAPIWVAVTLIVMARPAAQLLWRLVATWHILPFLWMIFYGFGSWQEIRMSPAWSQEQLPFLRLMFTSGFLFTCLTIILIMLPTPPPEQSGRRSAVRWLQLLLVLGVWVITTYLVIPFFIRD